VGGFEDVLTLDRHDPYSVIYDELLELDKKLDYQIYPHFNYQYKPWKAEISGTGNHLRGAYAYIIKPKAADKLITWIKTNGFLPADHQIGNAIVDIKMTVPSLARLHPAYRGKEQELSLTKNLETLGAIPASSHP
jgi:GR25 family glycosyltransferase involved in LPS biosynthesis